MPSQYLIAATWHGVPRVDAVSKSTIVHSVITGLGLLRSRTELFDRTHRAVESKGWQLTRLRVVVPIRTPEMTDHGVGAAFDRVSDGIWAAPPSDRLSGLFVQPTFSFRAAPDRVDFPAMPHCLVCGRLTFVTTSLNMQVPCPHS
jgi:hypothetical protein